MLFRLMDHGLNDVRHWLSSFHLQDYTRIFIDNGFNSLRKCSVLNESNLNQLQIPREYHRALLTGARNLQLTFPDKSLSPDDDDHDDDVPPPLPEKKNRRSLPNPSPRAMNPGQRVSPKPTRNPPSAPASALPVIPPSAPPRRSVLRKSVIGESLIQNDNSADSHMRELIPPPPPPDPLDDDLIDLSQHIQSSPMLPSKKNRRPASKTEESLLPMNTTVTTNNLTKDLTRLGVSGNDHIPMELPADPGASGPKKVRPPIKPRPVITPRPASMCKSPVPLRTSQSATLPSSEHPEGIYDDHENEPKSATLPVKVGNVMT